MSAAAVSKGEVLLLAPSRGLGGGIERYAAAIGAVFESQGVPYRRLNLREPGQPFTIGSRIWFIGAVRQAVASSPVPLRLVFAHINSLPVLLFVSRLPAYAGASVVVHGSEAWSRRHIRCRRWLRRKDVRVVAGSSYAAGALARVCHSSVVAPGISPDWYDTLVRESTVTRPADDNFRLVTAFRLGSWKSKGLPTILDALASLDDDRIHLTVCGSGPVPADLHRVVAQHPRCQIAANLSDAALADQLARADLFVLATRTQAGAAASGEGFGLVLLEAQLTGTPVIAPAYGGSGDAFQPGLTGTSPVDETPAALAAEIATLMADEKKRREMGEAAAAWARTRFHPETYARQLVRALLG